MTRGTTSFRTTLLAGLAISALAASAAHAQGAPDADAAVQDLAAAAAAPAQAADEDAIVVTGTRITRSGYSAPVPLTVVDAERIGTAGSTNVIDTLLKTPSITRGLDSTNGNNNLDAGAAFVNLRGLGTNRSLTLVNGRRRVSGSATSSAVDLNTIPAAMIERVEITTGGGSALYGADAVSGVVNVITKTGFEGLEMSAQGGISDRGDAANYALSVFGGTKFAEDRGSINFAVSYNKANPLIAEDRSYLRHVPTDQANPANTGPDDGIPDTIIFRDVVGYINSPNANFYLNGQPWDYQNGSLVNVMGQTTISNVSLGSRVYESRFGDLADLNFGERSLRLGSEVVSMRSDMSYELTDGLAFFAEGEFTQTDTPGTIEYYRFDDRALWFNATSGPRIRLDNYYLPADVAALMVQSGVTDIGVRKRMIDELGVMTDFHNRKTYSVIAGFRGDIADSWKWDVSYQYGQANDDIETPNLLRGQNFKNALDVIADPVTGDPVCRDAAARAAGCTPYNIWQRGPLTQAQRDYFVASRLQNTRNSQEIFAAHLNGDLFRLPAGAVAIAAGAERREEGLRTRDDAAMLSGDIRWGVGTNANARPPLDETFKVTEGYAEILAPIIHNTRFIRELSLDGAVRLSDYNTIGSTVAWQAGVNWTVSDDLRLRFSRSRSVRAPNLQELFGPVTVTLTSIGNPCGSNNINTTANRKANCIALGVAEGGGPVTVPQIESITGGNADLSEETSNSLTIGAVVTPRAIPNLRLSVDYYDITISGVITSPDLNKGCLDAATMAGNSFCDRMEFDSAGLLVRQNSSLINASEFSSSGIDFSADYRLPVGASGRIGVKLIGTYLLKKETLGVRDDPSTLTIQDGEYTDPRLRLSLTLGFDQPAWGVSVTNRFISKSDIDRQALPEAREFPKVAARIYTDALFRYDLSRSLSGFVGINNLLGIKPPQTAQTYNYAAFYDVIGRFFHMGVKAKF